MHDARQCPWQWQIAPALGEWPTGHMSGRAPRAGAAQGPLHSRKRHRGTGRLGPRERARTSVDQERLDEQMA